MGGILERGEEWGVDGAAPGVPGKRLLVRSLSLGVGASGRSMPGA